MQRITLTLDDNKAVATFQSERSTVALAVTECKEADGFYTHLFNVGIVGTIDGEEVLERVTFTGQHDTFRICSNLMDGRDTNNAIEGIIFAMTGVVHP